MGTMIDTPEGIEAFRLLSIKGRLQLEMLGMRFKGRTTFAIVKQEFDLKGDKRKVYEAYCDILLKKAILPGHKCWATVDQHRIACKYETPTGDGFHYVRTDDENRTLYRLADSEIEIREA